MQIKLDDDVVTTMTMDIMDLIEDNGIKIPPEKEGYLHRSIHNYLSDIDSERVNM